MFTLSAKGIYGLSAVLELGMKNKNGPVQIKDIAAAQDIPQHYLEQLLVQLKKAGLVISYRGAQGGYALADRLDRIKIAEVLACLEGDLEIVPKEKRDGILNFFWRKLEQEISRVIDVSLEDLILEKQGHEDQFIYTI